MAIAVITTSLFVGSYAMPTSDQLTEKGAYYEDDNPPVIVNIKTNKPFYGAMEYAYITVEIINNSDKTIGDISAVGTFNDLVPLGNENSLYCEDYPELGPGAALYYGYKVSINPSRLNLIFNVFLRFKNLLNGECNVPVLDFDDGRETATGTTDITFGFETVTETLTVWYAYVPDSPVIVPLV